MARRKRCQCQNPGPVASVLFQVVIGVATAVAASFVVEALRERRENAVITSGMPEGFDRA